MEQLDTQDRLLKAGTTLFAKKGYDGTSVKELAEAADVNISLVSYHFGGKEGLYRACLEKFGRERLQVAQRVLQPPKSHEEFSIRLRMFVEEILIAHVDQPEITTIIHRDFDLAFSVAPEVFRNTFMKSYEVLIQFFTAAQTAGVVSSKLDPQILPGLFFGGLIHIASKDKVNKEFFGNTIRDAEYRKRVADTVIHYCVHGCYGGPQ